MAQRTCTRDGCHSPHEARGLCRRHYNQIYYAATKHTRKRINGQASPVYYRDCARCGTAFAARRPERVYCGQACRERFKQRVQVSRQDRGICAAPECDAPTSSRRAKYCGRQCMGRGRRCHVACTVEGCNNPHKAWGMCTTHYRKRYRIQLHGQVSRLYYGDCAWCGDFFVSSRPWRTFCKPACARRASSVRRRGREVGAVGSYTWMDVARLVRKFRGCCAYCGDHTDLEPDHVIPLSRGGLNSVSNLLPSCSPCNSSKHDRLLEEWAEDRRRRGQPPRATTWGDEDSRYHHLVMTQVMLDEAA